MAQGSKGDSHSGGIASGNKMRTSRHRFVRFLIAAGWVSVVLGVVGIFLPVLPTTPFFAIGRRLFRTQLAAFLPLAGE